jgi:hypothetical protein
LAGGAYSFSSPDNWEYGPNALPPITSKIIIWGNGAVLDSTAAVRLRFFYISGGLSYDSSTLQGLDRGSLTLQNGKQKGGDSEIGGAGACMGAQYSTKATYDLANNYFPKLSWHTEAN